VTRLAGAEFSGPVANFAVATYTTPNGMPTLTVDSNVNAHGFVQTPIDSFATDTNTIYEVTAVVSTDIADRTMAPQTRLRVNNQSFQKGLTIDLDSNGLARFSPTPEGVEHKLYYVPARPPAGANETNDDWFFSLDIANFLERDAANASITLNSVSVAPIAKSRIQVAEKLVDQNFSLDSQGWFASGAPSDFTLAATASARSGSLDLAAPDANTFGYWQTDTGVEAQAGALYRGRFLVRSATRDRSQVPTIRLRLNLSTYEMAAVVNIESIADGQESPGPEGRLYDVYFNIPSDASGATILAAFDIANVAHPEDDENKAVSLDRFTLERVTIQP
jgi:hypothetical protein